MQSKANRLASSFRDPQGFVFKENGRIYRRIEEAFRPHYEKLQSSGLYKELSEKGLLVSHEELPLSADESAYKIIAPQMIPFISYPYEWSFSQLKDAALLTLEIATIALKHGMILKDASAYNIQFQGTKPILIDTLSLETQKAGAAWIAYRQFCEHFLAPLALMSHGDLRASKLLTTFIDGLPLDLVSKLLPWKTRFNPALFMHIYLHARAQKEHSGESLKELEQRSMPESSLFALLDNLSDSVQSLTLNKAKTAWSDYYANNNYTDASIKEKEKLVAELIQENQLDEIWDVGANTGRFSRIAAELGARVISMDFDPLCVEMNYQISKEKKLDLLPLLIDLCAPSPAIGWNNKERLSLIQRAPAKLTLALALIHHLAIANNVPLKMLAEFFHEISQKLIIEFVPKEDSQVQRLLASRADIFQNYNEDNFKREFSAYFKILAIKPIPGTMRTIYLMERIS
ncbi:MAG: hypothetical protein K2X27_09075 [Candidatus Obscuribacterales bacterium]|nr:hypothetical protein [Candidatus Obscuribacterales bacterium]